MVLRECCREMSLWEQWGVNYKGTQKVPARHGLVGWSGNGDQHAYWWPLRHIQDMASWAESLWLDQNHFCWLCCCRKSLPLSQLAQLLLMLLVWKRFIANMLLNYKSPKYEVCVGRCVLVRMHVSMYSPQVVCKISTEISLQNGEEFCFPFFVGLMGIRDFILFF